MLKKDGEVKVFVKKNRATETKTAEDLPEERYTVDDLVEDANKKQEVLAEETK